LEIDDIFPTTRSETAKTIVAQEIVGTDQFRNADFLHRSARGFEMRQHRPKTECPCQLFVKATLAILDDNPGNRFEQSHLIRADLVGKQEVDTAVPAQHPLCVHFLQQIRQIIPDRFYIARGSRLQDDQIDLQSLPAPQLMGANQIREQGVRQLTRPQREDGIVPGKRHTPKAGLAETIGLLCTSFCPQIAVWIKHEGTQRLKLLVLARLQSQFVILVCRRRGSIVDGPVNGGEACVALGDFKRRFP